ncbi:AraC family transcriptional regulator [Sorangium sp. So ce726]|uniref:AraC family transcriptional regulator n=1 Tax=Sorangium sp. So ce726 TaxID=3133319 RepID=UPI003F628700
MVAELVPERRARLPGLKQCMLAARKNLRDCTEVSNDPFSDILRLTEAKSVMSGGFAAGGTWAFRVRSHGEIKFYTVTQGACWLRVDGQKKAVRLEQGDALLLSGRGGFVLASSLTASPQDACPVFETGGTFAKIGDGSECVLLIGMVSLHPSSAALLQDVLPALVLVHAASPDAAAFHWMVERLQQERSSTLPGASIASAQLAQLIFIQVLRAHLASSGALRPGWLRAISDDRISRALRLMHGEPGRAWRLSELAKAAAMSRASFAVRFKSVAGVAPLAYLTEWRMRLAQRTLREEDTSISEIAESLGYASESAFSHAFKRVTGTAPRDYRNAANNRVASAQR